MKRKIWQVNVGHNWSNHTVEAKNYIEAGKKALKLAEPTPRNEKFVNTVVLLAETEK